MYFTADYILYRYRVYELDICLGDFRAISRDDAIRQAMRKFGYFKPGPLYAERVGF